MHLHAQQALTGMFCKNNRIPGAIIAPATADIIANTEAPFCLFLEVLDPSGVSRSTDPVDGLLITLLNRLHETVSGALVLLALGRFQQAEILSRTIMESALSFQYILVEHTGHRLVQYCRSYLKDEREQTRKWQNEIANVTAPWRADHERRIVEKRESVDGSEAFIAHFAALLPPSPAASRAWPGLYDICVALGKGVDYRTVHMAMCSQVHHDAEDILNDFIIGTASDYDPRRQNLERETGNFSIFLLLCSLRYYLECLNQLGARYRMPSVITQSSASLEVIEALAATVESEGFVSAKFDDFLPRSA